MRKVTFLMGLSAAVVVWLLAPAAASAQCAEQAAKLLAADGGEADQFGYAVDVSGHTAVIGVWRDSALASLSGSAYVYRLDDETWVQQQKLAPIDLQSAEFFGWSVAIDADTLAVGSISDRDLAADSGSVYIYRFDGDAWNLEAELHASDAAAGDHFGVAVALDGDRLLVGADLDNDYGTWSGSAYAFERVGSTWIERQKLHPSTPSSYEHFGSALALDGDLAVVGAYGGPGELFRGTAYVFRYDGASWGQEAVLVGSQSVAGDFFAAAVAVSGDRVLCGARWADIDSLDVGEAYLFERSESTWVERQRWTEASPGPGDGFGFSVALDRDIALIGVHNRDQIGTRSGEAVLFRHQDGVWQREPRVLPLDLQAGDMFGLAVALDGRFAVAGAPGEDDLGSDAGAAYVFDLAPCGALPGDLDGDGDVDLADLSLLLVAFGACEGDFAYDSAADLDANGCVDLVDLSTLLVNFGT